MDSLLLSRQELVSVHFISFLVHRHPEYRQAISSWSKQVKSLPSADLQLQLFLEAVPPHILKPVQEDYIRKGKPKVQRPAASGSHSLPAGAAAAASSSAAKGQPASAMSQHPQQPGVYQQQPQQHASAAAAAAAQQAALAAQQRGLLPNMPGGVPPRGQQFQGSNNAWANPGQAQLAQQQQARTVSPGPGQQAVPATQQQLQQLLQQQQQQQQLAASAAGQKLLVQQAGGQFMHLPATYIQQLQQQQQLQLALLAQQQRVQQQPAAGPAARRPGSAGATAPPPAGAAAAAKKPGTPGPAGALPSQGSAGNLSLLERQTQQQQQQQRPGVQLPIAAAQLAQLGQQRPPVQPGYPNLQMAGLRTGMYGQPGLPGGRQAAPLMPNSTAALVQQHLATLREGEAPKIAVPDGYEWVQCGTRDGSPGVAWYALPRASAAAYRAQVAKRKAEEAAAGQPAAKAGPGGVRKKIIDEDVTAGDDRTGGTGLDVMGVDDLQAELAVNEAAKGAVVVEAGNVQEEYVLSQGPTMNLLARAAKNHGVRAVGEDVYAYLSLATEQHLNQLLRGVVKARLQREDLGKGYKGVEKLDDRLRTGLFQIQKREKEAARKREEEERDELARLGASRKKLAEEDKKAAKAAQTARQLEQQQKNLGTTLTKMGIGRRTFGTMAALGRPAAAAQPKAGFTKPELQEAKAAAADAADGAGTAAGAAATADGPTVKLEAGVAGDAAAGSSSQAAASAAGGSVAPHVRPVSLQHQLLNASEAPGGGVPAFVAGGGSTGRGADGEEGLRELMLADLIAVLERHPQYCRSQQLYSLYALAGLPTSK